MNFYHVVMLAVVVGIFGLLSAIFGHPLTAAISATVFLVIMVGLFLGLLYQLAKEEEDRKL